jgi:uncharacterized membrane protein (GlpM family)
MYLFHALIGAIVFSLLHYFSLKKQYKLCALIPAIPIVGLYGLIIIIENNENNKNIIQIINIYLRNIIGFVFLALFFYAMLYYFMNFLTDYFINPYISIFFSLIIWLTLIIYILYK